MISTHWINMGHAMALVNERGVIIGVLHPLDEQISIKIKESFKNDSRRSDRYVINKEVRAV